MPYNPKLTWMKSLSGDVVSYVVETKLNGVLVGSGVVNQNGSGDAGGYLAFFSTYNPAVVLKDGDVIEMTVAAKDSSNQLSTTLVPTPASVTVPMEPPTPPTNGVLALS